MKEKVDVLILGRGGGSIEDLWAFNEEIVARAIFSSKIPLISAVGHERDWTISDFVADKRAATPSAAAELVVRRKDELEDRIQVLENNIKSALNNVLVRKKELLETLSGRYGLNKIKDLVPQEMQRLDELIERIQNNIRIIFKVREQKLENLGARYGLFRIKDLAFQKKERLAELNNRIVSEIKNVTSNRKESLKNLLQNLENLNPLAVLRRGYSISSALETGKIIKESVSLKKGQLIQTKLYKGSFISRVEKIASN